MHLPEAPEIAAVRETVRRFVASDVLPAIGGYERSGVFPHDLIARMGTMGFFGGAFPERLGGNAMGFGTVAAIAEELSRLAPELGYAMNMQAMTCPYTIYNWGTEKQVQQFVPDLIAGRKIGMFGLTEPGGGSDAAGSMRTTARRDGDVYRLNGSKQWITFANACDTGLLFAKTDPSAGHRGITAFIVEPKGRLGFTAHPIDMPGLSNCLRSCSVFLEDFVVPVENRLGAEGAGFKIAMNGLEYGRLTVSARLLGLAEACLELAVAYARDRSVGGSPIGRYQMVQHQIADMVVNIEATRLMVARIGVLMDGGERSTRVSSQGKYFAGLTARHAAQATADIFGAYALAKEYPINKLTAYIQMLCVGEGTPNIQRVLIAEDALGYKDADRHPPRNRFFDESHQGGEA